jgi:hypothetical protein
MKENKRVRSNKSARYNIEKNQESGLEGMK